MTITNDPTTDIGLIRIRIGDTTGAIFSDEQINAFLTTESGNTLRASASLLTAIAVNQALLLKVIKILSIATDGAKLAEALLKIAKSYTDQAIFADAQSGGLFDWAELVDDPFAARERYEKELYRL